MTASSDHSTDERSVRSARSRAREDKLFERLFFACAAANLGLVLATAMQTAVEGDRQLAIALASIALPINVISGAMTDDREAWRLSPGATVLLCLVGPVLTGLSIAALCFSIDPTAGLLFMAGVGVALAMIRLTSR